MAKFCTHCGRRISDDASFCRYCGTQLAFTDTRKERPARERTGTNGNEKLPGTTIAIIAVAFALGITVAVVGAIIYFRPPIQPGPPEPPDGEVIETSMIPEDAVEFNGHFYKLYNETKLWTEAEEACEEMDGHLVTITSEEEQDKIVEMIEEYAEAEKYNFWIGGSDAEQEGVFRWVTGELIPLDMSIEGGYENWKGGQPNNNDTSSEGDQDYLQICCTNINDTDRYGRWYDMSNTGLSQSYEGPPYYKDPKYSGYICEWDDAD